MNNLAERIVERYINQTRWTDRMASLTIHPATRAIEYKLEKNREKYPVEKYMGKFRIK